MIVYLVIQEGVHVASIGGVFSHFAAAKKCAEDAIAADTDSYHSYVIARLTMDKVQHFNNYGSWFPSFETPSIVWSKKK